MRIYLKTNIFFNFSCADIVSLPQGDYFTISVDYIPDSSEIFVALAGKDTLESLKQIRIAHKFYYVYFNKRYFAIPKEMCDVPLTEGGWFNI